MPERVFALPDLGEGLEEATVSAWLVAEGEQVALNQPFVEIETAKATVEVPAPWRGRLLTHHAAEGATVAVGTPLATFEAAEAEPSERRTGGPAAATPAVRKLAKDLGVELSAVSGSGPVGRITREDVEAFARSAVPASASAPTTGASPTPTGPVGVETDTELVEVSPIRRVIAERLTEVAAIPQVTTFRTVDSSALEAFRRGLDLSPLPVVIRALVTVVADHPMLNASWSDRGIVQHRAVHVGIATDTDRGLVVPVVRDAGSLGIGAIATEIERLARAAREGRLSPSETAGATIAVTNTGSYGSEYGTPLLDPGHAVTIALGVIAPRALVVEGRVEARPACTLSCTFDHRILDGAPVGRALGDLVALLGSRERLEALPR